MKIVIWFLVYGFADVLQNRCSPTQVFSCEYYEILTLSDTVFFGLQKHGGGRGGKLFAPHILTLVLEQQMMFKRGQ